MGAFHLPASHMYRRHNHLIRRQSVHQHTDRRDIRHRVHCSHLVEMNLGDRHAVHMAFRLRNHSKHCHNVPADPLRHRQTVHNVLYLMHAAVVMVPVAVGMFRIVRMPVLMFCTMRMPVFMAVHLLRLLFPMNPHGNVGAPDAALLCLLTHHLHPGNTQGVQSLQHLLPIRQKFQKSRSQHVSRRPHTAV